MLLDHTNPDSIARNRRRVASVLRGLRDNLARGAPTYNRAAPHDLTAMSVSTESDDGNLDVRLVSNSDGELWFATGDVQYDTTHAAACGAAQISASNDDSELDQIAGDLIDDVADQLATEAE
jgi:hypothetical protein